MSWEILATVLTSGKVTEIGGAVREGVGGTISDITTAWGNALSQIKTAEAEFEAKRLEAFSKLPENVQLKLIESGYFKGLPEKALDAVKEVVRESGGISAVVRPAIGGGLMFTAQRELASGGIVSEAIAESHTPANLVEAVGGVTDTSVALLKTAGLLTYLPRIAQQEARRGTGIIELGA